MRNFASSIRRRAKTSGRAYRAFLSITQNITERKRAEQEREELLRRERAARREAEEASRLKDEFLATVSHELRTPLNAILGWSQMLRSGNFTQLDSSRAVETIYRNAKSQAQLIEDILDVSRIITGKLRLEPRQIRLAPVIQSAVETLRPAIEAKNIGLQMRLNFEPRTVYADPDRLQQVVWNLLSNAIKFTPEKGEVTIELNGDETEARIIVRDNGKGISPEFLPFVFERFRQADGSSTRKHGGLGLGLAIVRHIVELHGGSIEAGSAGEDAGTTFIVHLPLADSRVKITKKTDEEIPATDAPPAAADAARLTSENSKIKGLRVLLLDDEADTLDLLGVFLSQNGAEVKAETSARGALEIIKHWQPDVIVSDIAMPEEDGYSFIKKLRALPPDAGGQIPVIALTAYVGIKERTQVLSNGFQMYVPKPVEPSELLEALLNFIDN
jgi:signal transduction histidine kinase/ActR/RegA family two-component response regulator